MTLSVATGASCLHPRGAFWSMEHLFDSRAQPSVGWCGSSQQDGGGVGVIAFTVTVIQYSVSEDLLVMYCHLCWLREG